MTDVQEFLNSTPGISKFIFGGRSVTVIPIPPEPPHDHVIMAVYVDGLSVTLAATWEWDGYAWWSLDAPGGPARWGWAHILGEAVLSDWTLCHTSHGGAGSGPGSAAEALEGKT